MLLSPAGERAYRVRPPLVLRSSLFTEGDRSRTTLGSPAELLSDAALRDQILRLVADPRWRAAIAGASPRLAAAIDALDEGASLSRARLLRVLRAVTQYVLRGSSRATPFGLLAGVARASAGDTARARRGTGHVVTRRWNGAAQAAQAEAASARAETPVVMNPLLERRGDRLIVHPVRGVSASAGRAACAVTLTPVLRAVLERAERPVPRGELAGHVAATAPATGEAASAYLASLLGAGVLLPAPGPVSTGPGDGDAAVDVVLDAALTLPQSVLAEVEAAAAVLTQLAPVPPMVQALTAYHAAFLGRYGTARLIPLPALLDPVTGLGAPAGYRFPPSSRAVPPEPGADLLRDAAVARNLGGAELVLDEALLASLTGERRERLAQPGLDLAFAVHAVGTEALDRGEFLLGFRGGAQSAGAMAGRFADALGIAPELAALARETYPGPGVLAQVTYAATTARADTVTCPSVLLNHELALSRPVAPDREQVRPSDLAVGSDGRRLYLVDARRRRPVTAVRFDVLDAETGLHNLARFILGLPLQGSAPWRPWHWGGLAALPRLPRVRLGRVVLAPETWRVPPGTTDVRRWAEDAGVPPQVQTGEGDRTLTLDLTDPWHATLLQEFLTDHEGLVITETPARMCAAHGIDAPWELTQGHVHEVVFPLIAARPRATAPAPESVPWDSLHTITLRHHVGGEWLSAKLYVPPERAEPLLTGSVTPWITELGGLIDRWFFLRYADPEPHLRVRLHGTPRTLREQVLPRLHEAVARWAETGTIRTAALDEYAPETDRYGGQAALPAAEQLFQADSELVLRQLVQPGDRREQAVASCLDLIEVLGARHAPWLGEVLTEEMTQLTAPGPRRAIVTAVLRGAGVPDPAEAAVRRRERGEEYRQACGGTVPPGAVMSVLHMHLNRAQGSDDHAERQVYGLLRAVLRAQDNAAEHGR